MKVGLVSAYDYAHPGGVTEHVRHLAAGLRRRGHDVTVFAPCSDKEVAERDSDFVRVGRPFPIPMHGSVARITVSLHLTNRIKHYVRDGGFDVIHYHEPLMPVLPVTALRFSKTCNVGTFHAFARSNLGYYYGKTLLKRYVRGLDARDAPLRRRYGNFLARKQLDDVVMAGYVPASDLPRYYASCDIFCSPATGDESFGIVLLEAMASGKPIVATSIDGFREVVTHGRDGLLVERKSRRQLEYALQTLINNGALRQEMGQAGLLTAGRHDWERVIDQHTEGH